MAMEERATGAEMEVEVEDSFVDDDIAESFHEICADLNLDALTRDNTWRTFAAVRQKYTLEGEPVHWLCCAVYVACRQANIPSVGNSPNMHGSYVNLTRLLRTSKLSLVDFFDKSRKWGDMTNMSQEFRSKIERLERNFAVTTVIYKKFEPIFAGIFKDFSRTDLEEYRANRKKLNPKSAADLFEFCWTLFLCVKSALRISDDLVNAYHLLLGCVDMVFYNIVQACRTGLLSPKFLELAEAGGDARSGEPTCIIHALCDNYDGISVEAKTIKEYWLKPKIRGMIDAGLLRGDPDTLSGMIDETVFENNYRKLEKEYEEYVLTEGDFDERMYLSPEKHADFGMDSPNIDYLKSYEYQSNYRTYPPLQELRHLMPQTPLTGKKYLPEKEDYLQSPISQATHTVSRLQAMLSGRKAEPSETLKTLLSGCKEDPLPSIKARLQSLSEMFINHYLNARREKPPGFHQEFALYRSQLGQTLYFRLLESVLASEAKLQGDTSKLSEVLMDDTFHHSMFACSMEIVLFSFNSYHRFPWILSALNLPGYHFFKVIEIIVRNEESLSRDVVKHLSQIEEKVLEELAWQTDSPIWNILAELEEKGDSIPSCDEVFLPSQMEKTGNEQSDSAPKRYAVIKTPQGEKCVPVAVGGTNQSTLIIQDKTSSQILGVVLPSKHGDRPKRGSSVALFFRKFYHLSFIRLQDICKNLTIQDETLRKIWTCFQQAAQKNLPELLKSRHLDQIIMCIVYVVSKVVGSERSFTEIMRCYRLQPQSASHVYRNVLLANPGDPNETRGDLIKFYNTTFITLIQKYALKFSNRSDDNNPIPLSPVPHLKNTPIMSPCHRVANQHSVYIRPLRTAKPSPGKPLRYTFATRSPNNSLKAINAMLQVPGGIDLKSKAVKRLVSENEEGVSTVTEQVPTKVFAKRLQDFMEERPGASNEGEQME